MIVCNLFVDLISSFNTKNFNYITNLTSGKLKLLINVFRGRSNNSALLGFFLFNCRFLNIIVL